MKWCSVTGHVKTLHPVFSRDGVRPFDRRHHSRRETRGSRTQDYRAKRLCFFPSLSCSQLLPELETRAAAQTDGEEVCVSECVCVCTGVCVREHWVVTPFGFVRVWEMELARYKERKLKREKHCRGVRERGKESSDSFVQPLIHVLFLFISFYTASK